MSTRAYVSPVVDHPHLKTSDPASIRVFLREYAKYVREVTERAQQLTVGNFSNDFVRLASLKYCVDQDWLESIVELEFIPDADD